MNGIVKKLQDMYSKNWGRWFLAFCFTAIVFAMSRIICPRVFFINDDENIMYTLAGYYTNGEPFDHSFVNYILGGAIRFLYIICPQLPWYGIFHVVILFLAVAIINKTILKECYRRQISALVSVSVMFALFSVLLLYPTLLLQFTTTSAYAGTAAVVLILGVDWNTDTRFERCLDLILSVLMVLLCFMHRKNTGYVTLCFYFGTVLYQIIKVVISQAEKKVRKKQLISLGVHSVITILLLGAVIEISSVKRSTDRWEYFYEYDNARFKMTDYPHDSIYDNPQLYAELGWNEELYELAGTHWWFFMDPKINVESFYRISQTGYYNRSSVTVSDVWNCAKSLFSGDGVAMIALFAALFVFLAFLVKLVTDRSRKRNLWEYLYGLCITGGAILLCLYLCYKQRFPLRAFHTICIPFIAVLVIVILRVSGSRNDKRVKRKRSRAVMCIALLCVSVLVGTKIADISREQVYDRIEKSNRTLAVEQYAMENPDYLYVYDTSLTFRYLPFTVYNEKYPSNLMFWGGMGWNSPAFFYQLELNQIGNLYTDVLFNENVYYVSWDDYVSGDRTMKDRLLSYMESIYSDVSVELVDTIGNNINIYKFTNK